MLSIGTTVVTFTATDHSGNSTSKSFTVQVVYNFNGYFTPSLNDGSAIFQSGRTVPVKFELTAADGTVVTNAVANLFVAMTSNVAIGRRGDPRNSQPEPFPGTRQGSEGGWPGYSLPTPRISNDTSSFRFGDVNLCV